MLKLVFQHKKMSHTYISYLVYTCNLVDLNQQRLVPPSLIPMFRTRHRRTSSETVVCQQAKNKVMETPSLTKGKFTQPTTNDDGPGTRSYSMYHSNIYDAHALKFSGETTSSFKIMLPKIARLHRCDPRVSHCCLINLVF